MGRKSHSKLTSISYPSVSTSRAHITIGCAPKVQPKQAGDDLANKIRLKQLNADESPTCQQDFKVEHGILRQFREGKKALVFYTDLELIVPGQFNAIV